MIKRLFYNSEGKFGVTIEVLNDGSVEVWAKQSGVEEEVFMQFNYAQFRLVLEAWETAMRNLESLREEM